MIQHPALWEINMKTQLIGLFAICCLSHSCGLSAHEKHSAPASAAEVKKPLSGQEKAKRWFASQEQLAIDEKFVGVTTSDGIQKGLFPIKRTGVSTEPLVAAALNFLGALTPTQQARTRFNIEDIEWRKWLNVDNGIYHRQGVSLKEMSGPQKQRAFALLEASLSVRGLEQARNIMKTDQTLRELNNGAEHFDQELYYFTLMGAPSKTRPWGWQIDGHHLAINYFVLGDQVVFSPAFMGAEPVLTTSGQHEGNLLFQDEQNLGLAFMRSLNIPQQQQARIDDKHRENMQAAGFQDNLVLDYQGVKAAHLSTEQQQALLQLTEQYVGKIRDDQAKVKMSEITDHLDNTWFAWAGGTNENAVFYYRIHSPVILIEFDHQGPVGIASEDGSRQATRNHIHTMIRTPNGNDYGKDLLKQHLNKHHH